MPSDCDGRPIAVFDIGGTWFRWGLFDPKRGLFDCERAAAISYLSHPELSSERLQLALLDFVLERLRELGSKRHIDTASISLGAPVNAHDSTVLGSGPLWGPQGRRFKLHARLHEAMPTMTWHLINDVTALLTCYTEDGVGCHKTMLVTVSTGIGSRLYDHHTARIPYDPKHGVQGEIGHLACTFELEGRSLKRQCECGGWNHLNAFSSGRGIAQTLREWPALSSEESDSQRLAAFCKRLDSGDTEAASLLDAFVTPLSRVLLTALCLDPDIDRIVITGGVVRGLGQHYRDALQRSFARDGLYQISDTDPSYLSSRLLWDDADDLSGLRGAGLHAVRLAGSLSSHPSRMAS